MVTKILLPSAASTATSTPHFHYLLHLHYGLHLHASTTASTPHFHPSLPLPPPPATAPHWPPKTGPFFVIIKMCNVLF